MLNQVSKNNPVCIFADDRYDDSMGAYTVFTLFDGESVYTEGGIYSDLAYNHYTVTGDEAIIRQASQVWEKSAKRKNGIYNKYAGRLHFKGCTVTLKRSRKAPNNTPLKVIADIDGGYNSRFNTYDSDKLEVTDGVNSWIVSLGCLNEIIEGVYDFPLWYISQAQFDKIEAARLEKEQAEKENQAIAEVKKQENRKAYEVSYKVFYEILSDKKLNKVARENDLKMTLKALNIRFNNAPEVIEALANASMTLA